MGLSKRQQKRLTRRRQKAQRKTNKRRNKNKRGGRKSRVKRQRKRGGAAARAAAEEQRVEAEEQRVYTGIAHRYPIQRSNSLHESQPLGPPTISEIFIPYYDVIDVIDSLCIFVNDKLKVITDKEERGAKRRSNLNRLIESYMTSQEGNPVKRILSTMIKRIITKDTRYSENPHDDEKRILTDAETGAIMSLIGVAIQQKLQAMNDIQLGDQNGLKNVFDLTVNPYEDGSIWSSAATDRRGRVPEGLIIDVVNTTFFIKEFIGRRFIYSAQYDDILEATQSIYKLIPPTVFEAANIDKIVHNTGKMAMEAIRTLQNSFDNLENLMFRIVFSPKKVVTDFLKKIGDTFSITETNLKIEMEEHAQNNVLNTIERNIRSLSENIPSGTTHDPSIREQSTLVQETFEEKFNNLPEYEKLGTLRRLQDNVCKIRPPKKELQEAVQRVKIITEQVKGKDASHSQQHYNSPPIEYEKGTKRRFGRSLSADGNFMSGKTHRHQEYSGLSPEAQQARNQEVALNF